MSHYIFNKPGPLLTAVVVVVVAIGIPEVNVVWLKQDQNAPQVDKLQKLEDALPKYRL